MLPSQIYWDDVRQGKIAEDAHQVNLLQTLDELYISLQKKQHGVSWFHRWQRLFMHSESEQPAARGIYLWGGVGRGKTYLMDIMFSSVENIPKQRLHFYRFMQMVHAKLAIAQQQSQKNPLIHVANQIAANATLLCFDEFFVKDVTDAMIMTNLWCELFNAGVVLFATSNIHPDKLYHNGVHRDRFLPTIALIHQQCQVIHLDAPLDYRLRTLEKAQVYHFPLSAETDITMQQMFFQLAPDTWREHTTIEINHRKLKVRALADDVVWFDFDVLCQSACGQYDYIELAKEFHTVLLTRVPVMGADNEDAARRFISLVDELYDRRVKLVISAATEIMSLYQGQMLKFEFQRTQSRLIEMQSRDYLSRSHRGC